MRKRVFGHMREANAQISLRIRAVWSGPSPCADRIIGQYTMYEWRAKARMITEHAAQDDMNMCILRMREDMLSLVANYFIITVDSRYLEFQGNLWNSSRYPYLEISELQKWGKQYIEQPHLTNACVIWLLKLETYWKYCGKEEKFLLSSNFSSFPQYFVTCC